VNYDFNRDWLVKKVEEIRRRTLKGISQLDDEQLNWRPNESSHSISTLVHRGEYQGKNLEGYITP